MSSSSISRRSTRTRLGARAGLVQITVAGVLWGTTGVAVQLVRAATGLSPVSIGCYRLAIAAVTLLLVSAARLGPLLTALRLMPGPVVLVGAGLGAYQALYFLAVTTAGVSVATVVSLGLAPVLTAGWEAGRARRLPGPGTTAPLVAGVVGLVLITVSTAQPTAAAPRPLLGLLAAVGSGLGYAAATVLSRHVAQRIDARNLTTLSTVVGAVTLAPLALVNGMAVPVQAVPVALLAYLGLVTTAVAYGLFYAGLRTTSGSAAAVLTLLEPLTAAVLAVAVLSEPLPRPAVAGGVLLLGAVAALYLAPAPKPRSRAPAERRHLGGGAVAYTAAAQVADRGAAGEAPQGDHRVADGAAEGGDRRERQDRSPQQVVHDVPAGVQQPGHTDPPVGRQAPVGAEGDGGGEQQLPRADGAAAEVRRTRAGDEDGVEPTPGRFGDQ